MRSLTGGDLSSVLALLRAIYSAPQPEGFVRRLLDALPRLTASDIAGYNEYNPSRRRVWYVAEPAGGDPPDGSELLSRFSHEHPLIGHYRRTRDGRALKISDFLSRPRFHRLGLYNEYFRRFSPAVEDLIAVHFGERRDGFVAALALGRRRKDYGERERFLLDLMRPHFGQAYRNAERLDELRRELALAGGALEALSQGVVALDAKGRVRIANERARQRLAAYGGPLRRGRLPQEVERWVVEQRRLLDTERGLGAPPAPLVMQRGERSLVIRVAALPESGPILLVDEHSAAPDPQRLRALGLTRRESEVTSLLARGRTNKQIARLLGAAPKTVEKHLQQVYAKLGVRTRTAAAARALSPAHAG